MGNATRRCTCGEECEIKPAEGACPRGGCACTLLSWLRGFLEGDTFATALRADVASLAGARVKRALERVLQQFTDPAALTKYANYGPRTL